MATKAGTRAALAVILVTSLGWTLAAQSDVTAADIQRLQDQISLASTDVATVRGRDAALASRLETELDEARDEAIYLKVKLRKNEPLVRSEYWTLRDRIDDIRTRARGDAIRPTPPPPGPATATNPAPKPAPTTSTGAATAVGPDVPTGTEFDVRLQNGLSSGTTQVEDRFEATTLVDLRQGERIIVPAGSVMRGVVSSVNRAGRVDRRGSLTVAFDQVTVGGRAYPIRATVTQALESEGVRGEAGRIGAGAGVGAIIGGILGGFRGAMAGILIGGGGTMAATEGKDVELPIGTVLRVRLDTGLTLR